MGSLADPHTLGMRWSVNLALANGLLDDLWVGPECVRTFC